MVKEFISIIIPAFNEEETISSAVEETVRVLNNTGIPDYELIIVNDGSNDKTQSVIEDLIKKTQYNLKVESYFPNRGKGFTLKKGVKAASGDFILFMDADLEIHPDHLQAFISLLNNSKADAVVGSKTARGSEVHAPLKRKMLSLGYYFLLKLLFRLPVIDTQTGFKLFKREPLKECIQKTSIIGYSFDLELLVIMKAHKYKIIESSVKVDELRSRRISFRDSLPMLKDTMKIFRRYYFSKSYN